MVLQQQSEPSAVAAELHHMLNNAKLDHSLHLPLVCETERGSSKQT